MEHMHIKSDQLFDRNLMPIYVDLYVHNENTGYHSHQFYEFVYIVRGFTLHHYNNVSTLLTPGDVFGIRPGDMHAYNRTHETLLYNCLFYPEALGTDFAEILKLPGLGSMFCAEDASGWQRVHLGPVERKEIEGYLAGMRTERIKRETGWELKLKSLLIEFLVAFSRAYETGHTQGEPGEYRVTRHVYEAIGIMEQHYSNPLSIEEIADAVGLSRDYFSREFKRMIGLSPGEYLKNVRLAKAMELLQNPINTIAGVAAQVGVDDPAYFTRQFKKSLGMSPSQYQADLTGRS